MTTRRNLLRLLALTTCGRAWAESSLYQQSLQARMLRLGPGVEVLVYDVDRRQTLANTFASSRAIPVGSLLKPFLAAAYLSRPHHPELGTPCRGARDRCWKPGGHGKLTLSQALAQSCNAYFLALAALLQPEEVNPPAGAPADAAPSDMIGLTPRWLITPDALAAAYAQLLPQAAFAIREGLALAVTSGTAQRIGRHPGGVLAKTGTAPCLPSPLPCRISGDGLTLAAVPAADPKLIVLTRLRGTNGATTASTAGRILTQLESLHAV